MDRDTWDEVLDVTLNSVFDITHAFIDSMAERRWGRVINISSFVARIGNFGQANYAADIDEHVWDAHAACQVSWRRDCAARMADVERGAPVWSAPPDARESSAMGRYLRWLEHTQGERFDGYEGLHAWSIGDLPRFWASLVE